MPLTSGGVIRGNLGAETTSSHVPRPPPLAQGSWSVFSIDNPPTSWDLPLKSCVTLSLSLDLSEPQTAVSSRTQKSLWGSALAWDGTSKRCVGS